MQTCKRPQERASFLEEERAEWSFRILGHLFTHVSWWLTVFHALCKALGKLEAKMTLPLSGRSFVSTEKTMNDFITVK